MAPFLTAAFYLGSNEVLYMISFKEGLDNPWQLSVSMDYLNKHAKCLDAMGSGLDREKMRQPSRQN